MLTMGAALGSHVHGSKDPKRKCCMTGIFPKTSPAVRTILRTQKKCATLLPRAVGVIGVMSAESEVFPLSG